MRNIENVISPFIESQFPVFYRDEGPNFISFVQAYFEWLEQNYQYLELDNASNFEIGDIVYQSPNSEMVSGIVEGIDNNFILVKVTSYEPFMDNQKSNSLELITSSSGGNSYISSVTSLNPIYRGRNAMNFRDVDSTIDEFILQFKEKYLKNIQFNIATNKQLLIKNSLDLYRSKGTERSIDLFFRLVYGVQAEVYYPGEDLFKLSDGEWETPRYLEISSSPKTIGLVGKQIVGCISGATAFVEKYIIRKIVNGSVNVLYISNISGEFINNEPLKWDQVYSDSPKVIGSLTKVEVITGGKTFEVGDIVSFSSTKGQGGLARVSSVTNQTGVVDFLLLEGGFGYTTNAEVIVSEKVLTISNVISTNTEYFTILEDATQPLANISFGHSNGLFSNGTYVYQYNGVNVAGEGIILSATHEANTANGILDIAVVSGTFTDGSNVYTSSNTIVANLVSFTDQTVTSKIMGLPNSAVIILETPTGTITANQEIYVSTGNVEIANAFVSEVNSEGSKLILELSELNGVFSIGSNVFVRNSSITGNVSNISLNFGVYNIEGTFSNTYNTKVYANVSGTSGNLISIGTGFGAAFKVSSLGETETIFINTDMISSNNGSPNTTFAYTDSGRKTLSVASNTGFDIDSSVYQYYENIAINPNTSINAVSGFISVPNANSHYLPGDYIHYWTSSGNTEIYGISNNEMFYVYASNTTGIILSRNYDHNFVINSSSYANFTNSAISETGHFISKKALGKVSDLGSGSVTVKGVTSLNKFSETGGTANTTTFANGNLILYSNNDVNTTISSISSAVSANVANQEFISVGISDYAYGFDKNVNGDLNDIIFSCLNFQNFEIGVITDISTSDPGIDYNIDPYVIVYEPSIAGTGRRDFEFVIENLVTNFIPGERVLQTSETLQYYELTVDDETGFTVGEMVYQGTIDSQTANAVISAISANTNKITVTEVQGTLANAEIYSYISSANTIVTDIDLNQILSTAKGIVKSSNSTHMLVKRITYNNTFKNSMQIMGQASGATANIVSVQEDTSTIPIGLNAVISANVITANGYVTGLQVIDSGYGYSNSEIVSFVSEDSEESGQAKLIMEGFGTGLGYFKSSKGFISANKYLIDSDYYQEYSYEVLTRLPFDSYSEVFKKVLHTAGTRIFGSVVLTDEGQLPIRPDETEYTYEDG